MTNEEFNNKKQYILKWMDNNLVHPESDPESMAQVTPRVQNLTMENADYLEKIVFMKPKEALELLKVLDK